LIAGNLDASGLATFLVNRGGEVDSDVAEIFGLNVKRDASLDNIFNAGERDKRCLISVNDNGRERHNVELFFRLRLILIFTVENLVGTEKVVFSVLSIHDDGIRT
jgi:hypothetical protein